MTNFISNLKLIVQKEEQTMKIKSRHTLFLSIGVLLLVFITITIPSIFSLGDQPEEEYNHTSNQYATMFQSVFQFVLDNYVDEVPPEQLWEGAMKGLFESLEDPHSSYLNKAAIMSLQDTTTGEFGGLGIHISTPTPQNEDDESSQRKTKELPYVKIVSPIEGTPAYRKGLKAGDYITAIEGETTVNMTSDEVLDLLRGEPGTDVTITILRNKKISFDVTITRDIIEIPTEKHTIIDGIGYLRIIQFTNHSAEQIKKALEEFKEKEVKGIIIDVRSNPGGLLSSVIEIVNFFFSDGVIVSTRSRIESENEVYKATSRTLIPKDLPVTVLINEGSASASEILTGAMKDRGRATIIGTQSHGKGSVQQMRLFASGAFKLTMARYYTPNDVNIDKVGISPDIEIKEPEMTDEDMADWENLFDNLQVENFVERYPNPTEKQTQEFIAGLREEGIQLDERYLRKRIRNEVYMNMENPPIYDLEYDQILQKAIEVIQEAQ